MLPKLYRLTKNKDFERVAKFGQSVYSQELTIKWIKNNLLISRFGFVISTKAAKRANVRNKIKRRLREIIRATLSAPKLKGAQTMTIKSGYDMMILAKPEIKELDFWRLKNKIEGLLNKARLLKD